MVWSRVVRTDSDDAKYALAWRVGLGEAGFVKLRKISSNTVWVDANTRVVLESESNFMQ